MADKIRYSVSVTPVETVTQEVAYTNIEDNANHADVTDNSYDVIATEVGTSLGGTGEAVCNGYAATAAYQGYLNQTVNYRLADDANDNTDISDEATASFVFIKNTGKALATDNTAVLGDTLDKAVKVMVGTTMISVLDPGEAIVLKDDNLGIACTGIHVRTVDLDGSNNTSAGHLAVEYLVVD
jgi:hypothetical protein|tara:strand:- start:15 stop:563 length:549 start_codon:yes stop_codon:yes gene_type:complete